MATLVFLLSFVASTRAVVFTNLYSFTGGADGMFPMGPLMQAQDGNLYGMTDYGGFASSILGYGTLYRIATDGTFTIVYTFQSSGDPQRPEYSGLVQDPDGFLYGTTAMGGDYGDGTVFTTDTNGDLFPIYSFTSFAFDGGGPESGVILTADGSLFGTTTQGGPNDFGTVFGLDYYWDYTNYFSFDGTNGANPYAPLVQAEDGQMYGTTFAGGTYFHGRDTNGDATGFGTVFRISTNGAFASLFSFSGTNGAQPMAGLVQGRDGALYGTTQSGGPHGYGTVYKVTTNGVFTLLFAFSGGGTGGYPVGGLVQAADGNFYGTTYDLWYMDGNGAPSIGQGTIFRITPSGAYTLVYSFAGQTGGTGPLTRLLQASDGNFYGTCFGGNYGTGMIFRLSISAPPVLQVAPASPAGVTLKWSATPGENYQIQYENVLGANGWANLGGAVTATNATMSILDGSPQPGTRFYRLLLLQ